MRRTLADQPINVIDIPQLPDNFQIPSPPSSSSDASDVPTPVPSPCISPNAAADRLQQHVASAASLGNRPVITVKRLVDTSQPPVSSQDSACFSFSRLSSSQKRQEGQRASQGLALGGVQQVRDRNAENMQVRDSSRVPYYMRTLDYVVEQVLLQSSRILRQQDIQVAHLCRNSLSRNAYALFARIYRRKQPFWYHVKGLEVSYREDIRVEYGVAELVRNGLLLSSAHVEKSGAKMKRLLAKELVTHFRLRDLKEVQRAVPSSKPMNKMSYKELVPCFTDMLTDGLEQGRNRQKYRQATLSGLSQADVLARAILKQAGHSVKIPEYVLTSLRRIHFLFFLENGHDSPNVILADTGKAKFPEYECKPKNGVFGSSFVYEGYEAALQLEEQLNHAMEHKDYLRAADIGSIAELEIREFLEWRECTGNPQPRSLRAPRESAAASSPSMSSTGQAHHDLRGVSFDTTEYREQVNKQLQHPFFRRFSAQWVFVRVAWHSVQALERLEEYENAIQRIKLLLSTGLVPARRGKCLNRLTINLFKHQGNMQEALDIILDALDPSAPKLHLGDRLGLLKRGLSIHRKLIMAACEDEASVAATTKGARRKIVAEAIWEKRPATLAQVIEASSTTVNVRKIYGKSLQITRRERKRSAAHNQTDPWSSFMNENSRESFENNGASTDTSVMGKSVYRSLGRKRKEVSVEAYCLQWYLGKNGWLGVHDEGSSVRFLFALLLWEHALFAPIDDVFQTPYQDRPLDLFTEAFYNSRKEDIEERLDEISKLDASQLRDEILERYERHENTRAIGCYWKSISAEDLACIAGGLGGRVLSHCCRLLCEDFAYWGGGLPDLTLWRTDGIPGSEKYYTKLAEVKSARDNLSEKQRAWLIELRSQGADCEVCKVVEKVTVRNADELEDASLDSVAIGAIDAADAEEHSDRLNEND